MHGLLFSVGYSCPFGSNQHKWTWVALQWGLLMPIWVKPEQIAWVALQFGLLMPFWVKIISKGHGLLFSVGCSCPFGSKHYQKDMGCSSAWVAQAVLGQTITNRMWVALQHGLLMSKYTFIPVYRAYPNCWVTQVTHGLLSCSSEGPQNWHFYTIVTERHNSKSARRIFKKIPFYENLYKKISFGVVKMVALRYADLKVPSAEEWPLNNIKISIFGDFWDWRCSNSGNTDFGTNFLFQFHGKKQNK